MKSHLLDKQLNFNETKVQVGAEGLGQNPDSPSGLWFSCC